MTDSPAVATRGRLAVGPQLILFAFAGIAVTVVIGSFAAAYRVDDGADGAVRDRRGEVVIVRGHLDDFDRPDNPSSLVGKGGFEWTSDGGTWGLSDHRALVSSPGDDRDYAVVDYGGGDGAVQVWASRVSDGAGLLFRYRDPANHWSVVAVPAYATWAVVKTLDGMETVVGNTGFSSLDGTAVGVRFRGKAIDIILGTEVVKTVIDGTLEDATRVGITARGPGAQSARFDDFTIATSSPP